MSRPILALNPGSSSLKAAVRTPELALTVEVERLGTHEATLTVDGSSASFDGDLPAAIGAIADELRRRGITLAAVSHRVVHGGPEHHQPTIVDDQLLADLRDVIPLAPLHLPGDLDSIAAARATWPDAQHVACFDTGFHHALPERSTRLPVPPELVDLGIRRYGFHGLSVQSVLDQHPDLGNVVVAHLGSGCSVTAVADGVPRHTTMSLTPTSGIVSGTRTGDLDPEIVLYLIQQHGYTVDGLRELFDRQSGLAGLAQGRHDVRDLQDASDDPARLALDVFVTDAAMAVAGCATTLPSWQSLVFTGGVGEHAEAVRSGICRQLLGVRGATADPGGVEEALGKSGIRVLVVPAQEEAVLDRLARELTAPS